MSIKKSGLETTLNQSIEDNLNIEKYISEILNNQNFDSLNFLRMRESERTKSVI